MDLRPPEGPASPDPSETTHDAINPIVLLYQNRRVNDANGLDGSNKAGRVGVQTEAVGAICCVDLGYGDKLVIILDGGSVQEGLSVLVNRVKASSYFLCVLATTSAGSSGAGGLRSHERERR